MNKSHYYRWRLGAEQATSHYFSDDYVYVLVLPKGNAMVWLRKWDRKGNSVIRVSRIDKYSLLMHCIKIKNPAKSLLDEQYVFVGGNISFLSVLSCSSEEA